MQQVLQRWPRRAEKKGGELRYKINVFFKKNHIVIKQNHDELRGSQNDRLCLLKEHFYFCLTFLATVEQKLYKYFFITLSVDIPVVIFSFIVMFVFFCIRYIFSTFKKTQQNCCHGLRRFADEKRANRIALLNLIGAFHFGFLKVDL